MAFAQRKASRHLGAALALFTYYLCAIISYYLLGFLFDWGRGGVLMFSSICACACVAAKAWRVNAAAAAVNFYARRRAAQCPPCGSDIDNTAIYTHAASIMRRDADSHTSHVTRHTSQLHALTISTAQELHVPRCNSNAPQALPPAPHARARCCCCCCCCCCFTC